MDPRIEELLADRALGPLDDKELGELQQLGAEDDDSYDRAAAALAVAGTVIESIPPAVAARILAASPAGTGVVNYHRTLPGIVMPPPDRPRDTMVGVDLEEIRLASQTGSDTPIMQPLIAPKPATPTKAMPVVGAGLPETLPPPALDRRPARSAPMIDITGPMLPPTSDYLPPAPEADDSPTIPRARTRAEAPAHTTGPHAPLQRPFSRTPLPQDSQPYSIESPPVSVPLPLSRPPDDRHDHDVLSQRHVAQQRQAAKTVPLGPRQRVILPWIAAVACLAIAGGAVWWSTERRAAPVIAAPTVTPILAPAAERTQLLANKEAKPITIAWTATQDANAHGASGDVVWSASTQRGFMRFVGLTPNDPGQYQYQLWIFDKARDQAFPVDGGLFDVTSTGEVIVAISPKLHVDDLAMFEVTIEKPGGVVVSKRERIVVTAAHT